jgi:hypothetical protein
MHLEISEIQKGINLVGLKISEAELNELKSGNTISLEGRGLSEIGSVFILAEALSARNLVKAITFQDLPKVFIQSSSCSGVPIYLWNSDLLGKCCLLLTLVNGKPAFKVSSSIYRRNV